MCGAFVPVLLLATGQVNFYLAFGLGMAAAGLLGVVLERVAFRPLRGSHPLVPPISAFRDADFLRFEEPTSPLFPSTPLFRSGRAAAGLLGVVLERVAFRPLRGSHPLVPLISAIGASIFLQSLALLLFGPADRPFPLQFRFGGITLGGVHMSFVDVAILTATPC